MPAKKSAQSASRGASARKSAARQAAKLPRSTPNANAPKAPKAPNVDASGGALPPASPRKNPPKPGTSGLKKSSPKDKLRAKAVEKEFGKGIRRSAELSGRKPATWREAERREAREIVLNKIGSGAVQRATTRTWEEWLLTLDEDGMKGKPHRDVVAHLATVHKLPSWWCQMVCVGYEQAHGQRLVHEKPGGFEISVSRSLEASASDVFRAFNDPARRSWSAVRDFVVRTTIAPRSLRLGMPDETLVSVAIERKGNTRCTVSVQHSKLPDAAVAEQAKAMWRDALAQLADMLAE